VHLGMSALGHKQTSMTLSFKSSVYALGCAPKSRAVQLSLHRRIVLRRRAAIEHTVIAHNADVTQPATRRQHD
jgi:hypothetical protein